MKYTFYLSNGATVIVDIEFDRGLAGNIRPTANAGAWLVDKNGVAVLMDAVIAMVPAAAEPEPKSALKQCGYPSPSGAMTCEREWGHPYQPPMNCHQGHAADGSRRLWRGSWD